MNKLSKEELGHAETILRRDASALYVQMKVSDVFAHITTLEAELAELKKPLDDEQIKKAEDFLCREKCRGAGTLYQQTPYLEDLLQELKRLKAEFAKRDAQLLAERERDTELLKEAFVKLDTASSGVESILDNIAARLKGEGKS